MMNLSERVLTITGLGIVGRDEKDTEWKFWCPGCEYACVVKTEDADLPFEAKCRCGMSSMSLRAGRL